MGSRIAKRLVSDRRGYVPGWRRCHHFAETLSRLLVCGRDGPKPMEHRLGKILGQFDSAAVLVT